ncbi:MAG: YncE family protein [Chitinophagaceae bacterium]|nr:MAG: YncE family protein [Chitinophagaceae bacterium]
MRIFRILFTAVSATLLLASCNKDNDSVQENPKVTTGVFTLSEGSFSTPSTTLTFYDFAASTASTDFFKNANSSSLGTLGNDMIVYGSKMYIVMNVDSYLEVADAKTAKHIRQIDFENAGGELIQPRYVVPYKNTVLVSSWDGTVAVIDTTTLVITKFITVGANPEQMVVVGDKLYVTNSGGLQAVMDSTVSVVDLVSQAETKKITVGVNPGYIVSDNNGSVFVASLGNYWDIGPKLTKINTSSNTVTLAVDTAVGKMVYHDGLIYATGGYLGSGSLRELKPSDLSQTRANFITDGTTVTNPYGVTVDPENGDIYIADAKNFVNAGEVFCFDKTGRKKFSFTTSPGVNPNTVVLVK